MAHDIHGIDHAIIAVHDLEAARAQYQKLGFTLTPRGSHIGRGTGNYCMMLEQDYIELLGIIDPGLDSNGLDTLLADQGEGLMGLALASSHPEGTHRSLQESGINPSEIQDLKRRLELPEGDVLPAFRIIRIAAAGLDTRHLLLFHHLTPELLRQPGWEIHANGARKIVSTAFVVEDPAALQSYYQSLLGSLNVTLTDETLHVKLGDHSLTFVKEPDLDLLYPGLDFESVRSSAPYPFALTVGVQDLQKTEQFLQKAGVAPRKISNGSLRVNPEHCCGVLMEFVQV